MAVIDVSIIPVGTPTPSLSSYIAQAVKVLQTEKGIKYELTALGTYIEGDLDQLLTVVSRMHKAVLDAGAVRVVTSLRIDERRDKPAWGLADRVASLKSKLNAK